MTYKKRKYGKRGDYKHSQEFETKVVARHRRLEEKRDEKEQKEIYDDCGIIMANLALICLILSYPQPLHLVSRNKLSLRQYVAAL